MEGLKRMPRILLAGATGYLGSYVAAELLKRNYYVVAIARNPDKLEKLEIVVDEILGAELTQPESIRAS